MRNGTVRRDDGGSDIPAHGGMILEHEGPRYSPGENTGIATAEIDDVRDRDR